VLCEYFIQNDESESNPKKNPYPNIYILPKKYLSVADVRVRDIVESFTLNGPENGAYRYLLRFESVMQVSQSKRIPVWMDLDDQLDVQAPNVKGKIRVKALRLPKGIEPKEVPKQQRVVPKQPKPQEPFAVYAPSQPERQPPV
jgi:hypothetical protein